MAVSGVVSRHIPYLYWAGNDTRSSKPLFSGDVHFPCRNVIGASCLRTARAIDSGFDDKGHVKFYYSSSRFAGVKKEKEKKLKLLKGLADDSAAPLSESAEAMSSDESEIEEGATDSTNDEVGSDGVGLDVDDADANVGIGTNVLGIDVGIDDNVMDSEEEDGQLISLDLGINLMLSDEDQ